MQQIPLGRIVRFAIATAMRQDKICRVEWGNFDRQNKMLLTRDRKDPRRRNGNDQHIPLLVVSGYDACKIIEEQRTFTGTNGGRIFPYNGRSVGTAFRRQCRALEGTSRPFEPGFSIEQVALVTGPQGMENATPLYHFLKPQHLHDLSAKEPAGPLLPPVRVSVV
jgi:hypothetical protein